MIPIAEPKLFKLDKKILKESIDSNWISSQGPYIERFEKNFAKFQKSKFAVAVSNCTTALHLALLALKIKKGDEVICPALTFISPANMIHHTGAKLKLVDVSKYDLNLNTEILEKFITKKTKAIIVVHQFGYPANMKEILRISKKYKLKIIEDNAESIGSKFYGKLTGSFGDIATYSFFGNKIITTGEGGMITTNNKLLYKKIKILRDHGLTNKTFYIHGYLGFNYRMTSLQAAIGIGQLNNLKKILIKKKEILKIYESNLKSIPNLKLFPLNENKKIQNVTWLVTIYLSNFSKKKINLLYNSMNKKGVNVRRMIQPVYKAKHFQSFFKKNNFPNAEEFSYKCLHLPSSLNLTKFQLNFICKLLSSEIFKLS